MKQSEMIKNVVKYYKNIVQLINPKKIVYVAIDGVVQDVALDGAVVFRDRPNSVKQVVEDVVALGVRYTGQSIAGSSTDRVAGFDKGSCSVGVQVDTAAVVALNGVPLNRQALNPGTVIGDNLQTVSTVALDGVVDEG